MRTEALCTICGSAISSNALHGLCPQCLLNTALRSDCESSETLPDQPPLLEPKDKPPATATTTPLAGDSIPGYEILQELHRGGQGVVYQAIHKTTRRRVAIKVMREGPFAGPQDCSRFEREVRILAAIRHPHIVSVHDSGTASGNFYFTMDYISGQRLDKYVEEHLLGINDVLRLFAKTCDAVNAAHLRGIIHRDLKPANILVDAEGEPHVLDFGLARVALGEVAGESQMGVMTITGEFVGSPPWAAPEQAEGRPEMIDLRTDVYALGVILFQVVTGHFPYEVTGNVLDILERIRNQEPAKPRAFCHNIGDEVETIILKCLAKDRDRRYQTAGELARDINHYLAGEPIEAKRDSAAYVLRKTLRRHWLPVSVAAAFVLLLSGALVVSASLWYRARKNFLEAEQGRKAAEEARLVADAKTREVRRRLYSRQMMLTQQALDTNSSTLKDLLEQCPAELRGWEWYRIKSLADQSQMTLAPYPTDALSAAFSPDGLRLISTGTFLRLWDAQTGQLLHERGGTSSYKASMAAYDTTGNRIVFTTTGSVGALEVWDVTEWRPIWALDLKDQPNCARFSPNGQRIAVGTCSGRVSFRNASTGKEESSFVAAGDVLIAAIAYHKDGQWLATSAWDGSVRIWDASTGAAVRTLQESGGSRVFDVAFSPDGKLLACGGEDQLVHLWDTATGNERLLLRGHTQGVQAVAFNPDGTRLCSSGRDATLRLWDTATGRPTATFRGHSHTVLSVDFSPDGQRLVSASRDRTIKLWNVEPIDETRIISFPETAIGDLAFSPDGKLLLVETAENVLAWDCASGRKVEDHSHRYMPDRCSPHGNQELGFDNEGVPGIHDTNTGDYMMRFEEIPNELTPFYFNPGGDSRQRVNILLFNPDYTRVAGGTFDGYIALWDVVTGKLLRAVQAHDGPITDIAYRPDGKQIATCSFDTKMRLWDADTGQEVRPAFKHPHWVHGLAFSPDGNRIATGGMDIRIWDPETGDSLATFGQLESSSYYCIAFSPDGRSLAASCGTNGRAPDTIRIWDAAGPVDSIVSADPS